MAKPLATAIGLPVRPEMIWAIESCWCMARDIEYGGGGGGGGGDCGLMQATGLMHCLPTSTMVVDVVVVNVVVVAVKR